MTSKPPFGGEVVRLGELIESSKAKNKDGLFADVYSVTNSHGFVPSQEYFNKEVYSKELRTYRVVHRNMIAYNPSRINVGSVAVQDKVDNAIVSPLYVVFSADETKVIPGYLVRFLRSKPGLDQIAQQSIGTVRSNLKFDALCKMQMPLPSLQAQVERMNKLTLVEQLADDCEHYLFHLDELVKSRFAEMFGDTDALMSRWPRKPLMACVNQIDSGKSVNCKAEARTGSAPGVLKLSALSSGKYLPEENKAMFDSDNVLPGKEVMIGDILVARKNTPDLVGTCVLVDFDAPNLMFPDLVFRMHPIEGVDGTYLSSLLGKSSFSKTVRSLAHGSAKSMSNIPKSELEKLELPLPPLALQREFADFATRVDKLRVEAQVQKEKLQTLYDSLAQDYFAI